MENTVNNQADQAVTMTVINADAIKQAVTIGQTAIAEGKTKADAVRRMFPLIIGEQREVIWQTLIQGAGLTERGAITYWYNVRREHKKGRLNVNNRDPR